MTKRIKLTEDPIQVSDGSKDVHLTVSTNRPLKLLYCESKNKPDKTGFHTLINDHAMNIQKGWSIWVWNPDEAVDVILGISEKAE